MARTIDDVLSRRVRLVLDARAAIAVSEKYQLLAEELGTMMFGQKTKQPI
jgi:hypothetical protein